MNSLSSDKKSAGGLKQTREKYFGAILRFTDMAIVCGVIVCTCNLMAFTIAPIYAWRDIYTAPTVFAILCFLLAGEYNGLYRVWRSRSIWAESSRILGCWFITIPGLLTLGYITKTSYQYSRAIFILWFLATPLILMLWRVALRMALRHLRKRGHNIKRIAIAGHGPAALSVKKHIKDSPWMGYQLMGIYHNDAPESEEHTHAPLEELFDLAESHGLDTVYITHSLEQQETIQQIVSRLADTNVQVFLMPGLFMSGLLQSRWSELGTLPVIDVFSSPLLGADGLLKRMFDLCLCIVLLPLLALPMLLIALAIKLSSSGPTIFRQKRYGVDGTKIEVLKFRTMYKDNKNAPVSQASPNDPRVTPLGKWLRSTSLDELPQLFNVLRGDMSLVGPRPHAVEHDEYYRQLIHGYMLRQKVPPGITGLAQVNGWRGQTEAINKMEKRVEYDLFYIRNWSISLDVKILFLTLRYGFNNKNAY